MARETAQQRQPFGSPEEVPDCANDCGGKVNQNDTMLHAPFCSRECRNDHWQDDDRAYTLLAQRTASTPERDDLTLDDWQIIRNALGSYRLQFIRHTPARREDPHITQMQERCRQVVDKVDRKLKAAVEALSESVNAARKEQTGD